MVPLWVSCQDLELVKRKKKDWMNGLRNYLCCSNRSCLSHEQWEALGPFPPRGTLFIFPYRLTSTITPEHCFFCWDTLVSLVSRTKRGHIPHCSCWGCLPVTIELGGKQQNGNTVLLQPTQPKCLRASTDEVTISVLSQWWKDSAKQGNSSQG